MKASSGSNRLVSIDALRGIAVLAVLVNHLPFSRAITSLAVAPAVFPPWVVRVTNYGQFGVHLFLVISGFCIHQPWARRREQNENISFLKFWQRRLTRLYPPYFISLLLTLAGLAVLAALLQPVRPRDLATWLGYRSGQQLAVDLVLLVLLMQNLNGASRRVGNGPFWSLALEEQLYMLYFPFLELRRRFGWGIAIAVVTATTLLWRLVGLVTPVPACWYIVGPARWFEWVLGALAVEIYMKKAELPQVMRSLWTGLATLCLAVGVNEVSLSAPVYRPLNIFVDPLFGLAFFALVCWASAGERDGRLRMDVGLVRMIASVGVVSYSLYLTHEPVIAFVKQLGFRLGLGVPGVTVLRLTVPIAVAYLYYRVIEFPFIRAAKRGSAVSQLAVQVPGTST